MEKILKISGIGRLTVKNYKIEIFFTEIDRSLKSIMINIENKQKFSKKFVNFFIEIEKKRRNK